MVCPSSSHSRRLIAFWFIAACAAFPCQELVGGDVLS